MKAEIRHAIGALRGALVPLEGLLRRDGLHLSAALERHVEAELNALATRAAGLLARLEGALGLSPEGAAGGEGE